MNLADALAELEENGRPSAVKAVLARLAELEALVTVELPDEYGVHWSGIDPRAEDIERHNTPESAATVARRYGGRAVTRTVRASTWRPV